MQLVEQNIGRPLLTNCTNMLWMSPQAKEIKAKIKKWNLIKLKSFAQQRKPFKT